MAGFWWAGCTSPESSPLLLPPVWGSSSDTKSDTAVNAGESPFSETVTRPLLSYFLLLRVLRWSIAARC
jgi:hypothetical protein